LQEGEEVAQAVVATADAENSHLNCWENAKVDTHHPIPRKARPRYKLYLNLEAAVLLSEHALPAIIHPGI
jgi:hypothetical protein